MSLGYQNHAQVGIGFKKGKVKIQIVLIQNKQHMYSRFKRFIEYITVYLGTPLVSGLARAFTHVNKPIGILLDPAKRNNQSDLARGIKHLDKITPQYLTASLNQEPAMVSLSLLQKQFADMQMDIKNLRAYQGGGDQSIFHKTLLDKIARIRPNAWDTYPAYPVDAEGWKQGLLAMT